MRNSNSAFSLLIIMPWCWAWVDPQFSFPSWRNSNGWNGWNDWGGWNHDRYTEVPSHHVASAQLTPENEAAPKHLPAASKRPKRLATPKPAASKPKAKAALKRAPAAKPKACPEGAKSTRAKKDTSETTKEIKKATPVDRQSEKRKTTTATATPARSDQTAKPPKTYSNIHQLLNERETYDVPLPRSFAPPP